MADVAASVLAKLRNKAKGFRHQLSAVLAAFLCRKNFCVSYQKSEDYDDCLVHKGRTDIHVYADQF